MRSTIFTTALTVGFAAAQATPTDSASSSQPTSGSTANSDTLPGLVDQLPSCAVSCLVSVSAHNGCSPTNFQCLCRSVTDLATSIGPCILVSSGCGSDEGLTVGKIALQVCERMRNNPDAGEVASASAIVAEAAAAATADGASPSATDEDDSAAARNGFGMGIVGAVGVMAFAL